MLKLTACSTNTLMKKMQCALSYDNLLIRELLLPNRITTIVDDVNPLLMVVLSWPCMGASHHGANTIYQSYPHSYQPHTYNHVTIGSDAYVLLPSCRAILMTFERISVPIAH